MPAGLRYSWNGGSSQERLNKLHRCTHRVLGTLSALTAYAGHLPENAGTVCLSTRLFVELIISFLLASCRARRSGQTSPIATLLLCAFDSVLGK